MNPQNYELDPVLESVISTCNLELREIDLPSQSKLSPHVWHKQIELLNNEHTIKVLVHLVINSEVMSNYKPFELDFENCAFIDDDSNRLVNAISSIFRSYIFRDKTRFFKRDRVIILDDKSNPFMYPRTVSKK